MAKWKGNPTVTLVGNVVKAPEVKFTPSGLAVANLTMVTKDREETGGEWRDVDETFWRVTCWRQLAENLAECDVVPGQEIIVTGPVRNREYEVEGEKRRSLEITANTLGISLARVKVTIIKPEKVAAAEAGAVEDPWAKADIPEEPPF